MMPSQPTFPLTAEERVALLQKRAEEDEAVVSSLRQVGIYVESIYDLVKQKGNYTRAVPLLLKLLPSVSDSVIKQGIVRALGEKDAIGLAEEALIGEFLTVPSSLVGGESLKWAIGNTLEILASDKYTDQLINLVLDKKHGSARQMIVVGLGRLKSPKVVDVLINLLDDDDVCGHAVIALGRLKALKAASKLKQLRNHPKHWIKVEVNKALKRMKVAE